MSSRKVTYETVPADRLRKLESEARTATSEANQRKRAQRKLKAERGRNDRIARSVEANERSHKKLQSRLEDVGKEFAAAERRHVSQRNELRTRLQTGLRDAERARRELGRDLRQELAQQGHAIRSDMANMEASLHAEVEHLATQMRSKEDNAQTIALRWVDAAGAQLDTITEDLMHDLFAPGEVDALRSRATQARSNVADGVPEAGLSLAQQTWFEARTLRDRLELEQAAWEELDALARQALEEAQAALDAVRHVELQLGGEPSGYTVDVDHWSDGGLTVLERLIDSAREVLDGPAPGRDALEALADNLLALPGHLDTAEFKARGAVVASIYRADAQATFLDKLQAHGWTLDHNTWDTDDQRQANRLVVRNGSGDRMAVQVSHGADGLAGGMAVRVSFDDRSPNETIRAERLAVITGATEGDTSPITTPAGFETGNAPATDFGATASAGPQTHESTQA